MKLWGIRTKWPADAGVANARVHWLSRPDQPCGLRGGAVLLPNDVWVWKTKAGAQKDVDEWGIQGEKVALYHVAKERKARK